MTNEVIELCQKMLDEGKADGERHGYRWDNRHPIYREIYAAFNASDLEAAKRCWQNNFC